MQYLKRKNALLILEDGSYYQGKSIGIAAETGRFAEVVFNTSLSGYQEIISDPSYKGQMVCFTYPSIGNYGVNKEDNESAQPQLEAIIVREYCEHPSNFRSSSTLEQYLLDFKIAGITGVDTRKLVRNIRESGSMRAAIYTTELKEQDIETFIEKAVVAIKNQPTMQGLNLAANFSGKEANNFIAQRLADSGRDTKAMRKIAVLDFGVKYSILDNFIKNDIYPVVFAGDTAITSWPGFKADDYSAFFLSNGPGDPSAVKTGVENIKVILKFNKPMFGICLGHQMLSLALGAKTFKMKFGHHGGNQPVKTKGKSRVLITAQNHGFAVDEDSLMAILHESSHHTVDINPNDQSVEGFSFNRDGLKVLSVQFHPEAAPGPNDARVLFKEFIASI